MSDEIKEEEDTTKSDFVKISGSILTSINYKIAFFLFAIGMIIFSDVFIDNVLKNCFSDTTHGDCTTTKGTMLQLLFLCIGYILLDLVVKAGWM